MQTTDKEGENDHKSQLIGAAIHVLDVVKRFLSIYPGVFFESDRDVRSVGAAGAVSFAYLKRITELLTAFRK